MESSATVRSPFPALSLAARAARRLALPALRGTIGGVFVGVIVGALALGGCSSALVYQVRGSDASAGSDAKITADIDTGKSITRLHIEGTNITPPERIIDGATLFVAWARKNSSVQWTRLGALTYDASARKIIGELTSSLTSFDFIVTVEKAPDAESPSGKTVFIHRVN